ncbi:Photosystem II PsbU protein [Leptolyngbya boryana NIES-2135]|jgi:photosystem II PsbU protein|uniref:Photosystem II PsbU protein n=1 Tax=Leptolyngbya boryana NIES-2135 TaxID=1973484 RepID=A0A1Z4JK52_LEPBY|nr:MULTISPECIES: photosystem II complex extrinsic protein PsbU [Leptolyngbya]BAY57028.1 Photosystem II PsbU protein [Leptolyngbya boryana NIES-2135]MBD2367214.1 hypothetical protein [Leptolyngbya sp. FACHB-161]MBD2373432.1 hypothetical protein [Leptolyngbya sp. FACHB-238]MBD2397841.1 hypothetical protein [Leptolyngbya sp. FACHB-239]MBD2404342.1 hypothetical protein [Leptolyngbya sp. FACHB-402]
MIDLNNADVRAFQAYPGMYPTLAKKILQNAPYSKVTDVLDIPGLVDTQKKLLEKNLDNFTVSEIPDRFIDDRTDS